ncbi:MAG: cation transporting ATPase C-terminal domain-containing protein [Bifidobacterium bifidum]
MAAPDDGSVLQPTINIGIVTEIVLLVLITEVPVLQTVFHTAPLGWDDCVYLCCIPFVILGIEELRKLIWRHSSQPSGYSAPPRWRGQVAP